MKSSTLAFAILVAISPTTMADDSPTWQGILGDLVKTEKAGYGGLCGIVLDPAGGTHGPDLLSAHRHDSTRFLLDYPEMFMIS